MRRNLVHHLVMSSSSSRHLRRHTLIAASRDGLSEGVLVAKGDRTVVEVIGGPPFATLELFAAERRLVSVHLDQLGSGSAALNGVEVPIDGGSVPVVLRHGGTTVLRGFFSTVLPASAVPGGPV